MSDEAVRSRRDVFGLGAVALGGVAAQKVAASLPPHHTAPLPSQYRGGHLAGTVGMRGPDPSRADGHREYDDWRRIAEGARDRELAIMHRRMAAIWRCRSTSQAYKEAMAARVSLEERTIFERFEQLRSAAWRYLLGD